MSPIPPAFDPSCADDAARYFANTLNALGQAGWEPTVNDEDQGTWRIQEKAEHPITYSNVIRFDGRWMPWGGGGPVSRKPPTAEVAESTPDPRPGDRVRVTWEGAYEEIRGEPLVPGATVEVLPPLTLAERMERLADKLEAIPADLGGSYHEIVMYNASKAAADRIREELAEANGESR